MTTLREAAQMALEALNNLKTRERVDEEIAVLRAALASQIVTSDCSDSHQPDAWRTEARNEHGLPVFFCASEVNQAGPGLIPLYTAPPQRQPLSNGEVWGLMRDNDPSVYEAFRLCERAHGIGGEV